MKSFKIIYYFRVAIQMTAVWETTTKTLGSCVVCPMKKLFMAKICLIFPRQELPSCYTFCGPEVTLCLLRFSKWRGFWQTVKGFCQSRVLFISLRKQRFFLALRRWERFARSETSLSGRRARRNRCFRRLVIYMLNDNLQNELERLAFPFCRCQ